MNFNLKTNPRPINTAPQYSSRKPLSFPLSTKHQTTPLIITKTSRNDKFQSTNYTLFKQKNGITQQNQLEVLQLVKIPPNNQFATTTELNQLEFSPLSYSINQLIRLSKVMIDDNSQRKLIGKSFNLHRLIELIAQNYLDVSYHNFSHAFSLLQALYQCYNRSEKLKQSISQKKWFFVFIAALAHDLQHPGTNNAFEVKAKTQNAKQASNQSVLEKMHLHVFWNILRKNSQVNFLQGYSKYESEDIKKLITRMILSTDVSKHFKGVQSLQAHIKNKNQLKGQNSLIILQQLFHACDISNPCLNFDSYMNWSALVSYQFHQITRAEEKMGLPVTGFLKFQTMNKFYKGQVGFCNMLVLPLWRQLGTIYPGLQELISNISSNVQKLQKKIIQTS